ncbi:MAG: YbeD family protein [Chromatocurvus sp.]
MSAQEPPKIEFPCEYPIKVIGRRTESFQSVVIAVFERYAPGFDHAAIAVRDSRKGTFATITVTITATGEEQLRALHRDLMATGLVQMVL